MTLIQNDPQNVNSRKPSLADAAAENLRTGVLLLCKEALVTAIQDRRLDRKHLRVLAAMVSFVNTTSALAWPSRQKIAELLDLSVKTVSNVLLELRNFGYLIAEKATVEQANNRRLTVYTFGNIDHETIRAEITRWVQHVRDSQAATTNQKVPTGGEQSAQESPRPQGKSPPAGNSEQQEVPARGGGKSPPAGDSNSKKELSPYGGAKAPDDVQTFTQMVWKVGIKTIVSMYGGSVEEKDVRSRLGRLIKEHGQALVLDAIGKAEQASSLDPLDFMTGVLRARGGQGAKSMADVVAQRRRFEAY